jgi:DUF4097 and DUF4098 domain-containing protein YvlB
MKPKFLHLFTILAVTGLPFIAQAQGRRNGPSTNISGDRTVTSCRDIEITYDRRPAITDEASMTVPASQVSTLKSQMTNGGLYLTGWDRNEFSITTCKAVPSDDANPQATLRDITTNYANGQLSVSGPSGRDWTANVIIMVPRLSTLDLQTRNGPLQLRDLAGNIRLSASNGPISLNNVGGIVQATTSNGPISLNGASGDQRLTATNGPIHVGLSGSRWDGPGLEVTTQNGPLSLSVPDSYSSGIAIQTSDHSPVRCSAPACATATRSLGSPSVIRLGNGDTNVRLSTVNGPLSIQGSKD